MPYSKFTIAELKKKFGLQIERIELFEAFSPIEISEWHKQSLKMSGHVSMLYTMKKCQKQDFD